MKHCCENLATDLSFNDLILGGEGKKFYFTKFSQTIGSIFLIVTQKYFKSEIRFLGKFQ